MIGLQVPMFAEPVKSGYSLRPYQLDGSAAVDRALLKNRSTCVVWATGLGKTVLFTEQARKRGGCLVIAHRDSLIRSAAEKLQLAAGPDEPVAIEKAQERAHFGAKFIVGSVQTLKGARLKRFADRFPKLGFIVIDEAHRATAKSYRAILAAWPEAKVLLVTATPDRSDGVGLWTVCDRVSETQDAAHEYNIIDATADGWLTPLKFVPVHASFDLSNVKITKQSDGEKDFDQKELDSAVVGESGRIARAVVKALEEMGPGSRLIGFCPGVATSKACTAAVNELLPGAAAHVDGEMTDAEKRPVLESHRTGKVRVVFNCNVLSEGHDDATLTGVFDASPSRSRLRVAQRWGRATRLWPAGIDKQPTPELRRAAIAASPKPFAVIFDLVSNSTEHDVIGPVDLLGGKGLPPDVAKRAARIMREKGGEVMEAVEAAQAEEAKKRAEAEDKARRQRAAKAIAAATAVTLGKPRSVFDRAGLDFIKRTKLASKPDERCQSKHLYVLKKRGIPIPKDCTLSMFRRLLNLDEKRQAKGLVRLGGVDWLRSYGVDGWKMPSATAIRIRDAIKAKGRKLTTEEIAPLMLREPGED